MRANGTIVAWGVDGSPPGEVPTGDGFTQVVAGGVFSMALAADGSIVGWGFPVSGLFGDMPDEKGFIQLALSPAGGDAHALRADGSIVSWGSDIPGGMGDNWGQVTDTPEGKGFTQIAAGGYHTLALHENPPCPCASATGPVKVQTLKIWGPPTGTDWWWYLEDGTNTTPKIRVPGVTGDYNGDGAYDALDAADSFKDSINDYVASNGCDHLSATTHKLYGTVYLDLSARCLPSLFVSEDFVSFCNATAGPPCTFNPQIELVPLPGWDCNENGLDDEFDLASGLSQDLDGNGILDECEFTDCNGNGVDDALDLASGTSLDTDFDGILDECEAGWVSPWTDLGGALPGDSNMHLSILGTLGGSTPVTTILSGAIPDSTATLVLGFTYLNAPFKANFLGPAPDVIIPGFPTGPQGEIQLNGTWPANIQPGFEFFEQWWMLDPGAPQGAASGNTVRGVTP